MKLVLAPAALAELHDAAAFYTLKANVELGLAFVAEFERAANIVLDNPLLGAVPARFIWTQFCNSGGLSHGIGLTGFVG